jgi:serine O-acetyltransferase
MFEWIRSDMQRYRDSGGWYRRPGFWVSATYRFGSWCQRCRFAPLRYLLLIIHGFVALPWHLVRWVVLPSTARIGPGLCLHHPFNILIPPTTVMGEQCTISHEVTLGYGPIPGMPRIGDRVTIGPGARVLGGITVGDDARIGANAVAIRDVPAGASLAVAPARVIPAAMVRGFRRRTGTGPG